MKNKLKKMEDKYSIEFFPNSTLEECQFYFYCQRMAQKDRLLISKYIKAYKGVRIFFIINIFYIKYSQYHLYLTKIQLLLLKQRT